MAHRQHLTRDAGHPFTREAGWDLLEVEADTEAELTAYVAAAARKFWHVWIRDTTGVCRAALYKPANAHQAWDEASVDTPLAHILDSVNLRAARFHADIVLSSLSHQVRAADSLESLGTRMRQVVDAYGRSGKALEDASAGLVGAVPLFNRCLTASLAPPDHAEWRVHAMECVGALQMAVMDDMCALNSASSVKSTHLEKKARAVRRP